MARPRKTPVLFQAIKPVTRSAIYLRVSTEEQATDGYGLDAQAEKCRAMAIVKGWGVLKEHIYTDAGISGTKGPAERPALAGLLAAAELGHFDAVIVAALDRLGRKTQIVLSLADTLAAAGVQLVSCKESLDTTTPTGQFVLTMFAALAQLDRDNIVERTTGGRNARGKIDGEKGGKVPYGYRRVFEHAGGKATGLEIVDHEAAAVRAIIAMRQSQTLQDIADALTVPSPGGAQWSATAVYRIIRNEEKYRGAGRNGSAERWPAILST